MSKKAMSEPARIVVTAIVPHKPRRLVSSRPMRPAHDRATVAVAAEAASNAASSGPHADGGRPPVGST
jgi:hypothetical protein